MQMRYLLWNPGSVPVRVGEDILLPAGGYSSKIFDRDEIDYLQAELHDKHIRICRIAPMGPDGHRLRRRQPAETSVVEPSFRQRELYKKLTGQELAGDVDRIEASRRIELAMTARNSAAEWDSSFAEQAVSAQPDGSVEVLMNRLFISVSPSFPKLLEGITVLVNLSGTHIETSDRIAILNLPAADAVDAMLLAGVVRLCAASIRGVRQRVLLYGTADAGEVLAACILREHLGIPSEQAARILRRVIPNALMKPELINTLGTYRPS